MPAARTIAICQRVALNAFIALQVFVIIGWGLPSSRFRDGLVGWLQEYVVFIGIWHSWDMFSPDPLIVNFNLYGEVILADGQTNLWEFPRMEKLSLTERFQKERYRKWRERVRQDAYHAVWRDTAKFIARQSLQNGAPPKRVVLVREWDSIPAPLPPPGQTNSAKGAGPWRDDQPMPDSFPLTQSYRFHTYFPRPGELP